MNKGLAVPRTWCVTCGKHVRPITSKEEYVCPRCKQTLQIEEEKEQKDS